MISVIRSSSRACRPWVSTMMTSSLILARPSLTIFLASCSDGSPKHGTFTLSQRVLTWVYAPGLKVSAQITATRIPFFLKNRASFAVVVVLPEPCRPAIRITCFPRVTSTFFPTRATSSSYTILRTCSLAVTPFGGCSSRARFRMVCESCITCFTFTSAWSSAR